MPRRMKTRKISRKNKSMKRKSLKRNSRKTKKSMRGGKYLYKSKALPDMAK